MRRQEEQRGEIEEARGTEREDYSHGIAQCDVSVIASAMLAGRHWGKEQRG